jgi:hypothetical protein
MGAVERWFTENGRRKEVDWGSGIWMAFFWADEREA